jgi:hypothetical protein
MKPIPFGLGDLVNQTYSSRVTLIGWRKRITDALADADKAQRHAARECVTCYYLRRGSIVGHGFTDWTCGRCQLVFSHANTGVPRLCHHCSEVLNACVRCCADLELKQRRKLVHKKINDDAALVREAFKLGLLKQDESGVVRATDKFEVDERRLAIGLDTRTTHINPDGGRELLLAAVADHRARLVNVMKDET